MSSRLFVWATLAASLLLVLPAKAADGDCPGMDDALATLDECVTYHYEAGDIERRGIYLSLLAKALVAQDATERGDADVAIHILQAFINEIDALSGVQITGSVVDLVHHAEMAVAQLGS